jgi:hypothetical protein
MFDYPAHAICLFWDIRVIAPDVAFNLGIAMAYFAIPFALYRLIRSFDNLLLPFRSLLWMFTIFIFACGTSHIARITSLLFGGGYYLFDILVCGITFASSVITALLLFKNGRQYLELLKGMLELQQ